MSQGTRRLAAIMFTDMVGYTALGQKNESFSLALVDEQRKLTRPILARHNGREVKTIGDAFLVEFPNALDAVRCAYDIQRATREFNFSMPEDRRIHLRVGVHLGDVVESQGDISGDAVNIASRIQPLAEDGGVCLTREVYDQVKNKVELPLESIGARALKNVDSPMGVYKIVMPWGKGHVEPAPLLDTKRIAVLPFASMSPDPDDEYFADGLTEELIDRLCQVRELGVIARTSVMNYKGEKKNASQIGRELKAGSLVEGSVRKAGNRIRVTAQLVNANNEEHLWSSHYDKNLDDIFAVQSDIAEQVVAALKVRLLPEEKRAIEKKATQDLEAYKLYLKGRYYWSERTRDGTDKAVKYFEEAVRRDPTYALAYAGLADCCIVQTNYGWLRPKEALSKGKHYALRAIDLDPSQAEPHASLGNILAHYDHKWEESENELRKAMDLKPSYATAYHWYSLTLRIMGRIEESYEQMKRAAELDPVSMIITFNVGEVLLIMRKDKEAIEQLRRVIETNPNFPLAYLELGWAYFFQSRVDEAVEVLRKPLAFLGDDPHYKAELACFLGFIGRLDEANKIIEEIKERSETIFVDEATLAFALFGVGKNDEAFAHLERAYEDRSDILLDFAFRPWFSEARKDARWVSLKKRLGLVG
ncbi:MAG TPA: adenylate/guanylate cyclase domain-containing protein [Nitrososphaerales archaeon]